VTKEKDLKAFSVVMIVKQWKGNRVWIEKEDRKGVREIITHSPLVFFYKT
jgi:hypothetical protein